MAGLRSALFAGVAIAGIATAASAQQKPAQARFSTGAQLAASATIGALQEFRGAKLIGQRTSNGCVFLSTRDGQAIQVDLESKTTHFAGPDHRVFARVVGGKVDLAPPSDPEAYRRASAELATACRLAAHEQTMPPRKSAQGNVARAAIGGNTGQPTTSSAAIGGKASQGKMRTAIEPIRALTPPCYGVSGVPLHPSECERRAKAGLPLGAPR